MTKLAGIVLALALVAGCSGTPGVATAPVTITAQPSVAAPSVALASADPEVTRKAAGIAYLAAAKKANAARKAVDKKYPANMSLKQARAYFAALAKVEGAFLLAMKDMVVPPDTVGDLHTLSVRQTAVQAIYIEVSKARSIADLNKADKAVTAAQRAAAAAANQVRSDLDLPPVGS